MPNRNACHAIAVCVSYLGVHALVALCSIAHVSSGLGPPTPRSAVVAAAALGSSVAARTAQQAGSVADVLEKTGHESLHYAVYYGDMAAVRALVEAGADVEEVDEERYGSTPVFDAAQHGHLSILVYLVEECGASLRHVSNKGETIMHRTAYYGHLDMVRYVAKKAPELADMPAKNNYTPIMSASGRGRTLVVRHLARLGCSLSRRSSNSHYAALNYARANGHHDTVRLLSDIASAGGWPTYAAVRVADALKKTGHESLMYAAKAGDMVSVRALVEAGADVDEANNTLGVTAALMAAQECELAILVYLVKECGADVRHTDIMGATLMHKAVDKHCHLDVLRYLAKKAPDLIDRPTPANNWSPLMDAGTCAAHPPSPAAASPPRPQLAKAAPRWSGTSRTRAPT